MTHFLKSISKTIGMYASLLLVAITVSHFGCSGCFFEEESDNLAEYIEIEVEPSPSCEGVALESTYAKPTESVAVDFEFEHFDPSGFGMEVTFDGVDTEPLLLPVYRDLDDEFFLVVPPHPNGIEGGDLTLEFSDGDVSCEESISFEVTALPRAPGTFEEIIKVSSALAESIAHSFDYEVDELIDADAEDLPPMMIPIAFQLWALDHPDNDNSLLRRLQERDLPVEHSAADFEFAQALLAVSGHVENLEARRQAIDEHAATSDLEVRFRSANQLRMLDADVDEQKQGQTLLNLCGPFADKLEVDINNLEELSDYMQRAHFADSHGKYVEAASFAVGVVSIIPGVGVAGAVAGLFLAIGELLMNAHANLLPRKLTDPELRLVRPSFPEDYIQRGSWAQYRFSAETPGWDATADIASALWTFFTSFTSIVPGSQPVPDNLSKRIAERLDGFQPKVVDEFLGDAADFVRDNALEGLNEGILGDSGLCRFDPGPWGPFVEEDYESLERESHGSIVYSASLDDELPCNPDRHPPPTRRHYEPNHTGAGGISVAASGEKYPPDYNSYLSRISAPVTVSQIEVVGQHRYYGVPGEEIELTGTVKNALDKIAVWDYPDTVTKITHNSPSQNPHTFTLRLPDSEEDFPVFVYLHSVSTEGLRHDDCNPEPRQHLFTITNEEELRVVPRHMCIAQDSSHQFDAVVAVREGAADVEWSVTNGSIDDGYFVPSSRGEAVITAEIPGTDLKDEARVRVGGCGCYYNISAPGAGLYSSGFDDVFGRISEGGTTVSVGGEDSGTFALINGENGSAIATISTPYYGGQATATGQLSVTYNLASQRAHGVFYGTGAYPMEATSFTSLPAGQTPIHISFMGPFVKGALPPLFGADCAD